MFASNVLTICSTTLRAASKCRISGQSMARICTVLLRKHGVTPVKLLLQIVMTRNKEAVLSEKDMRCNLGQTCLVGYAEHIDSTNFVTFEEFLSAVQNSWDSEWRRVYTADWSGTLMPHSLLTVHFLYCCNSLLNVAI
jgi:hypothetical protein